MKKIFIYSIMVMTIMLGSCAKNEIIYNQGVPDPGQYSKVYMPRASTAPDVIPVSISDEVYKYAYNAYFGGPVLPENNINITFSVQPGAVDSYNQKNGTSYKIMPEGNYTIETTNAVIPAGQRSTGTLALNVKTNSGLVPFETYLLPLSISKVDGGGVVNDALSTTYFIFNVTYPPGQVPTEKVLSLGADPGNVFSRGAKGGILIKNKVNSDILLYLPDANGSYTTPPKVAGINFGAAESLYYVNENSIVARNTPPAGLFSFFWGDNNNLVGAADPNFWLGDGWDAYTIVPYKDYFLLVDGTGNIWRQPALSRSETAKTQVGTGFQYTQIEAWQNSLLALDTDGKLWLYPMSEDGVPGVKRQVGSGWDIYRQIIVIDNDVLGLDDKGDVYRYKFNPQGFFALK